MIQSVILDGCRIYRAYFFDLSQTELAHGGTCEHGYTWPSQISWTVKSRACYGAFLHVSPTLPKSECHFKGNPGPYRMGWGGWICHRRCCLEGAILRDNDHSELIDHKPTCIQHGSELYMFKSCVRSARPPSLSQMVPASTVDSF